MLGAVPDSSALVEHVRHPLVSQEWHSGPQELQFLASGLEYQPVTQAQALGDEPRSPALVLHTVQPVASVLEHSRQLGSQRLQLADVVLGKYPEEHTQAAGELPRYSTAFTSTHFVQPEDALVAQVIHEGSQGITQLEASGVATYPG